MSTGLIRGINSVLLFRVLGLFLIGENGVFCEIKSYARGKKGGGGAKYRAAIWGAPTPQHLVVCPATPTTPSAPAVVVCLGPTTTGCGAAVRSPLVSPLFFQGFQVAHC